MDIDATVDRLLAAYDAAGLAPIAPSPDDIDEVLMQIATAIAPLTLPADVERFWRRVDPTTIDAAPSPAPASPASALEVWQSHRDDKPGMTPNLLFPVCAEGWAFLLVELHDARQAGGACFAWSYDGESFDRWFPTFTDHLDVWASLVEAGHVVRGGGGEDRHAGGELPEDAWVEAVGERMVASLPHPVYGHATQVSGEVDAWPEPWLASSGLLGDRDPGGANATVAEVLEGVAAGETFTATLHGRVVGLAGTADGRRATIDDGTGRLDIWCPAAVCARGPVIDRRFAFDVEVQPGAAATADLGAHQAEVHRAIQAGDQDAAADAGAHIAEMVLGPTVARAGAVRSLRR